MARTWSQAAPADIFKPSKDPLFAEKVAGIGGLYLAPPAAAVVQCVDEKSGVQALDRTQPWLPLTFDKTEKRTHDYVRHGTVNLFGALDVATGKSPANATRGADPRSFSHS